MKRLAVLALVLVGGCEGAFGSDSPWRPETEPEVPGVPPACDDELALFDVELWRPILAVRCIGCHSADGAASGTRMVLRPGTDEAALRANFEAVSRVALTTVGDVPLLLLKPTGQHPDGHTGGTLVSASSFDYERLSAFVDVVSQPTCNTPMIGVSCDEGVTFAPPAIRRLTPAEYDRSVEALLGFSSTHGEGFAADPVVDGFSNQTAALQVSPLLASQLQTAARAIATEAATDVDALTGCAGDPSEACARTFFARIGRRAFRRDLEDAELDAYVGIFREASGDGFGAGIELGLAAMLQSPHFLYRMELGVDEGDGTARLTGSEVATSMAYLLTGGPPDETLLVAAEAGELDTGAGRRAAAETMLAGTDARAAFARFVREWLDLDRIATVPKDGGTYPGFDDAVRASMLAEVDAFVDAVVFDGPGTFEAMLTAPQVHPDATLASFYGVSAPPSPYDAVADDTRSGLLTLGAVLTVAAGPEDPSPVLRGRMIRTAMLCQPLPDPPPGLVAEPPPIDPSQGVRERWSEHSEVEPCASCHRLMDPIGFAFEAFDAVGRHRTTEPNGHPVDIDGEIVGTRETDGTVRGVQELGAHLAASREVQDCFVAQWFRFAYGAIESSRTRCALQRLQDRFVEDGLDVRALILATVEDDHFVRRASATAAPPPMDPPGDPPPPPPPSGDFGVVNNVDSSWPTGACHQVMVTNEGDSEAAWSVVIDVPGTINNHWNSEASADTGAVTFTGTQWNRTLAPGQQADFGYCYQR